MTLLFTLRLHFFFPALILAATPCLAAHQKKLHTHPYHVAHKNRADTSLEANIDLTSTLAHGEPKNPPVRAFDALVHSLSLPLDHPASQKALQMLGTAYKWGGTSAQDGMDCSGYVWRSFKDALNVALPRSSRDMASGLQKILPHELRAGDLVFFNTRGFRFSHVGIYLGGTMFAHSPRAGSESRIDNLDQPYWLAAFDGARRVPIDSLKVLPPPQTDFKSLKLTKIMNVPTSILEKKHIITKFIVITPKSSNNEFSYSASAAVTPQTVMKEPFRINTDTLTASNEIYDSTGMVVSPPRMRRP